MCWCPIQYLPLNLVLLALLLQLPDVGAEPGAVLAVLISEVILMFVPSFLECVPSKSSIMFHPICCCDAGHINDIVFLALSWGQWAVARPTLAVTALDMLLVLILL